MESRRLGTTGMMVPELCLGCMTFGRELDEEVCPYGMIREAPRV